jgi:pimeloyl-ACP methyl ester carboxylesterase
MRRHAGPGFRVKTLVHFDDHLPQYRAIHTPTLMIVGEQDRAIPLWQQRKIYDLLPNTRWEEIPSCGHVVYLEKPKEFFGMIRAFMEAKSVDFEVGG